MRAWRIAKKRYALDRSGAGGLAAAGRWNPAGVPAVYAGLSVEICVVEKLVHLGTTLPNDLVLVELHLPDETSLYEEADMSVFPHWDASPPHIETIEYGGTFLRSGRALGLIVPSAIVPEARKLLINPVHPRFADVSFAIARRFEFDPRLRGTTLR